MRKRRERRKEIKEKNETGLLGEKDCEEKDGRERMIGEREET